MLKYSSNLTTTLFENTSSKFKYLARKIKFSISNKIIYAF